MSDHSPYETLGVTELASFEEVQSVRDRLLKEHIGDSRRSAQIESAYDAVLMQRLKLRQEGKIKVPDDIRFAEKTPLALPKMSKMPKISMPSLPTTFTFTSSDYFAKPETADLTIPTLVAIALTFAVAFFPTPVVFNWIAFLAMNGTIYGIYRKDRHLGSAVLAGFVGVVLGYLLGVVVLSLLPAGSLALVPGSAFSGDVVRTWGICFVLWLLALFVK